MEERDREMFGIFGAPEDELTEREKKEKQRRLQWAPHDQLTAEEQQQRKRLNERVEKNLRQSGMF